MQFVAILCVLLLVVAGTVQVVHMHSDGTDTHANCSLCAAAHVSVQAVQQQVFTPPAQMVRVVELNRQSRPAGVSLPFALSNRPPPAA
jgi:hypothetical protein